jgi:hypothetical protein
MGDGCAGSKLRLNCIYRGRDAAFNARESSLAFGAAASFAKQESAARATAGTTATNIHPAASDLKEVDTTSCVKAARANKKGAETTRLSSLVSE